MTKILRLQELYTHRTKKGELKTGRLGISRTTFYENYVKHPGGDEYIPGTEVPRLRLAHIGERAQAAFDDEVDQLIEGLRAERDSKLAKATPPSAAQTSTKPEPVMTPPERRGPGRPRKQPIPPPSNGVNALSNREAATVE
jgi:hypothetical protein